VFIESTGRIFGVLYMILFCLGNRITSMCLNWRRVGDPQAYAEDPQPGIQTTGRNSTVSSPILQSLLVKT